MRTHISLGFKALALAAAASLAACGGGSTTSTPPIPAPPPASAVLTNVIGMGDSLTAGYQSGGFLGDTSMPDPFYPGLNVPPGQESGWWSQFYMQATGSSYLAMANPATSVLPLILKPGLSNQLVPNNPAATGVNIPFLPLSQAIPGHGCDSFSKAAYSLSTFGSTRMNPAALPKDLGVPGITLHEAITMYQPNEPTCAPLPGPLAVLQPLLSEAGPFYPVLGTYASSASPLTMLNAAVAAKPTLTTVWLGANDVLHYTFSGGQFTAVDTTTAQVTADMTQIITTLQRAGSAVVVANVPNVLHTAFFFSMSIPANPAATCPLQSNLFCFLISPAVGLPPATAATIVGNVAAQYKLGTTGYITLEGVIAELTAAPQFSANLDTLAGGNGNGSMYVTPALASAVQAENDTVNSGIAASATATGVPMVDVKTILEDIYTGNTADPLAAAALTVNPGKCCSMAFFGGLLSFDGLHPSNTGYALIADAFIQAVNTKYGTTITPVSPAAVYNGTGKIPFPDPYAQH